MMKNQSPVWAGLYRICLVEGIQMYIGVELRQDSSPGVRGLEALLPLVPLFTLGAWAGVPMIAQYGQRGERGEPQSFAGGTLGVCRFLQC